MWRGALLLCDWLLYAAAGEEATPPAAATEVVPTKAAAAATVVAHHDTDTAARAARNNIGNGLADSVVLELGAGTGLVGLLASRCGAARVFLTDVVGGHDTAVLANCAANVEADTHPKTRERCVVRELDWTVGLEKIPRDEREQIKNDKEEEEEEEMKMNNRDFVQGGEEKSRKTPPRHPRGSGSRRSDDGTQSTASHRLWSLEDFEWRCKELEELENCELILAADCVYDDRLTDAFFVTLARIFFLVHNRRQREEKMKKMKKKGGKGNGKEEEEEENAYTPKKQQIRAPRAMCAMERRVNFGLDDETPRAHAFERFLLHLGLKPDDGSGGGGGDWVEGIGWGMCLAPLSEVPAASRGSRGSKFKGRRLDLFDVPQRVMYDRVGELELWEVTLADEKEEEEEEEEEEES